MLIAKQDNQRIQACHAVSGTDYLCPDSDCGGQLRLRKRKGYVPHFFHRGEAHCANDGESREHETAKIELQTEYRNRGNITADLEVYWSDVARLAETQEFGAVMQKLRAKNRRCDVLLKKSTVGSKANYFAIEVQGANLASKEFNDRIHDWNLLGIPVIWMALLKPAWQKSISTSQGSSTIQKTTLRDFEAQMLRRYGHIWYFDPDTRNFYKGKIEPHQLYKNPTDYFDQNAREICQGGGYPYDSTRWIDLVLSEAVPMNSIGLSRRSNKDKRGAETKMYDWCVLNCQKIDVNQDATTNPVSLSAQL